MKRTTIMLVMLYLAAGAVSIAGAGEPITIGETVTVFSKILDEERTILISTPPRYGQSTERYPVLYMTDGNAHLTHTRGTVDFLARNTLAPQLIIVCVANTDRTRDLTPTHATMSRDDGTVREFPTSGGAPKFLDFFAQELFPYVEEHYRTQPYRLFAGHSFGGLFALNAFFARPEVFNAILAVSPSLRWDDELPIRQAAALRTEPLKQAPALFVTMGNEEEGDPRPNRMDRLEEALEGASGELRVRFMRMPDETHGSVVLRSHYWGLRDIFDGWRLPADPDTGRFTGALPELKAHFAGLSKTYGFAVIPPEATVNQVGYQMLGGDDVDGAIAVFTYNTELHPDSANVYDSLGEALERVGRLDEALANYCTAVDNAKALGDERLTIFETNRDRVKGQMEEEQSN